MPTPTDLAVCVETVEELISEIEKGENYDRTHNAVIVILPGETSHMIVDRLRRLCKYATKTWNMP